MDKLVADGMVVDKLTGEVISRVGDVHDSETIERIMVLVRDGQYNVVDGHVVDNEDC